MKLERMAKWLSNYKYNTAENIKIEVIKIIKYVLLDVEKQN